MITYILQTPGTKPHPPWCSLTYSQAFGLSCCEHDQPAAACSMKCTIDVIIALICNFSLDLDQIYGNNS